MKSILFIITIFVAPTLMAKTIDGLYEIPVDNPALEAFNKFKSSLKYNGGDMNNASKITVTLPAEMMGINNDFILTKDANGTWKSDSDIFDNIACEINTKFECFMDFKQSIIQNITGSPSNLVTNDVSQNPFLVMDLNKAENLMLGQGLAPDFIRNRINIISDFVVEPRGILSYDLPVKQAKYN